MKNHRNKVALFIGPVEGEARRMGVSLRSAYTNAAGQIVGCFKGTPGSADSRVAFKIAFDPQDFTNAGTITKFKAKCATLGIEQPFAWKAPKPSNIVPLRQPVTEPPRPVIAGRDASVEQTSTRVARCG